MFRPPDGLLLLRRRQVMQCECSARQIVHIGERVHAVVRHIPPGPLLLKT